MRGIYSLRNGAPATESVPQVVIVLDADQAAWLGGWVAAHLELRHEYVSYPRELADVLSFADPYDHEAG